MASISLIGLIRRTIDERARAKRVRLAAGWPLMQAHIDIWKILPAGDASESFPKTDYIEASFSFLFKSEYYGGYVRSIALGRKEAEKLAVGSPSINIRYNPANPDQTVVLAEDNLDLPFKMISG